MSDEQPTASEPVEKPEASSGAGPWYADPWFMAGVGTSVLVVLWLASRTGRGCPDCRKHREAEAAAAAAIADTPPRTPAAPPQTPGPGVADLPTVDNAPPEASPPTLVQPGAVSVTGRAVAPTDVGPSCTRVEWCALPDGHDGMHLGSARPGMSPEELAAAAAAAIES